MLKIITAPNQLLNLPVKPVKTINDKIKRLVFEMEKTLINQTDPPGVGLAAPQVGKNLALFIVKPTKKAKTMVFINPKIVKTSYRQKRERSISVKSVKKNTDSTKSQPIPTKLEGCLSIPRIWGPVKRADRVLVEFQDLSGKSQKKWFEGMTAIIIQHEIDHLNGILFTQRAIEQNLPLYEEKDGKLNKIEE